MTYQEKYQKLIEELTELEDKKEELSQLYLTKQTEKNQIDLKCNKTEKDIEKLENKKETLVYSKKINELSTLFGGLIISIVSIVIILSLTLTTILKTSAVQTLALNLFGTLPASALSAISTFYIFKKIIINKINKIKNSEEYKKIIEDIKTKEEEKEMLLEKLPQISQEIENILRKLKEQNYLVEIKINEIEGFKNEVFYSVVDEQIQNKEKDKPYTKIKSKENK